jgi:uncharacterized protein YndB with AHSA1/START domain
MRHFSITVEIQAPPKRVWAVMSDIESWPEWTPTVTSIQRADRGPLAVGHRARIRQPGLPLTEWQVTELDEGSSFTWVTRRPGVRVTARHGVEAYGGGSRVTLSLQFSGVLGPLVARLTSNLNERYLALEARGLRERSEGSTGSPRIVREGAPAGYPPV